MTLDEFIQKNIGNIDANRWDLIYEDAAELLTTRDVPQITSMMLSADIHPENYLKQLPELFLAGSDIKNFIIPDNIISINNAVFLEAKNLTSIILPSSIQQLGEYAFKDCSNLSKVVIESNKLKSINTGAFLSCFNLKNINIPEGIEIIKEFAFSNCGLSTIKFPASISRIESNAFDSCTSLTSIYFEGTIDEWNSVHIFKESFRYVRASKVICKDGIVSLRQK